MALEGEKESGENIDHHASCTFHHNNDDERQQQQKILHQFYFIANINNLFPDPDLQANLNVAKKLNEQMEKRQAKLLNKMRPLKEKLESLHTNIRDFQAERMKRDVEFYRGVLEEHWPNEDLEQEPDPDIELIEIKEKIPKLIEQLGHGKTNWAREKEILKELEHLQIRAELLDRQFKEAEAKVQELGIRWVSWRYGSKYDLKRKVRYYLRIIKKDEERKKVATMQQNQEIAKLEKQIAPLQKRYNLLKQENEKAKDYLMALEIHVKKQV